MTPGLSFFEKYDTLELLGRGSFGTVRKVRRKADGRILAQKELDIQKMVDIDRRRTVSEINILKSMRHEHIVRYHERYTDNNNGVQYIIMEYCGGGDLYSVITQAVKERRVITEDAIWRYFGQIILALHYCHSPSHDDMPSIDPKNSRRRPQILHRDLKPENIFLDENNNVKLGDFGLSKALVQAGFTNTVVGTPYYMSPEVMQERPYDAKSDIWSLGCIIHELAALQQPFASAKKLSQLKDLINKGSIPPLPERYSHSLSAVVKNMLDVNAVRRPSTGQLLETFKEIETEKRVQDMEGREKDLQAREVKLNAQEREMQAREHEFQNKEANMLSREAALGCAIKTAIAARDEEVRVILQCREQEMKAAHARREDEIISSVNAREREFFEAWREREEMMEERARWCEERKRELVSEEQRMNSLRKEVKDRMADLEQARAKGADQKSQKTSFDDVENSLEPFGRVHDHPATPGPPIIEVASMPGSAMRGVILTSTGEALTTPGRAATLSVTSPKVALDFAKMFDVEEDASDIISSPSRRPPARLRRPSVALPEVISMRVIHARAYAQRS